ncbi:hypothetical protein [Marinobacter salsuginis]|uniref:Uncharacterized protein n=1 Tax=Marinobacter salsuginis TaxID=418719 RepID=A0A5M3Q1W0_9GAMM|nr:hypothetical protein [Marinobacter salsuginis]GBO89208.1 hypothetical protein MSSD14B_28760 [Marinobacter salsuginis]
MSAQKQLTDIFSADGECKFHDSAALPLPANFNPGSIYLRVHIRIDTPSYRQKNIYYPQFADNAASDKFYEEMGALLSDEHMIVDGTYARTFGEVPEKLHIHPDDLNGLVSLDRLVRIVEAIKAGKSSVTGLRWVDVYAICEELDDDEKLNRLTYYREELAESLLDSAFTGKRKIYRDITTDGLFYEYGAIRSAFPGLQFVEHFSAGRGGCQISHQFKNELINDLINQGLLHERFKDGRQWHRASLKTELNQIRKADRTSLWKLAERVATPKKNPWETQKCR